MMQIKIKKLHPLAGIPEYQTLHAAGADLTACLEEPLTIAPMEIRAVPTGFAMEIPAGYEAQIRPRSGLASKGLSVPNAPGTIDADYRGEVKVILVNLSSEPFTVKRGERIAQIVPARVAHEIDFKESDEVSGTVRGAGGFGHTGK